MAETEQHRTRARKWCQQLLGPVAARFAGAPWDFVAMESFSAGLAEKEAEVCARLEELEAAKEGMRKRLAERAAESDRRFRLAERNGERWEAAEARRAEAEAERDESRLRIGELEEENKRLRECERAVEMFDQLNAARAADPTLEEVGFEEAKRRAERFAACEPVVRKYYGEMDIPLDKDEAAIFLGVLCLIHADRFLDRAGLLRTKGAERAEALLHARTMHPDFEYATTEGPRKAFDEHPPEGDGWKRNVDAGRDGWERFDYHEEAYWRRGKHVVGTERGASAVGKPCPRCEVGKLEVYDVEGAPRGAYPGNYVCDNDKCDAVSQVQGETQVGE